MPREHDVIQHIRDEEADDYSDDDLFSISSWGADLSFRELIDRYEEGSLEKPELQRHYVWTRAEASRFIDSLLLGLPVPSIFLAKTGEESTLIVDGYQRIMTVHDYVTGVFSGDHKVFRLSRSEKVNSRWRGKAFTELTETEQRKIRNTTIHAIIFVQKEPSGTNTSLYQVFERINTTGRTLLPQEIRNCIYQGDLNTLLVELNANNSWRGLFGLPTPESRMRDMEFILRFFALSSEEFAHEHKERISLKKFLNSFMGTHRNPTQEELGVLRARFSRAVEFVMLHFGGSAFHNVSPSTADRLVPKFSPTIFDSIMIAADQALARGLQVPVAEPEGARRALLRNEEYRGVISQETMRTDRIRRRVELAYAALFGEGLREGQIV
jgi:hypothetical protein